MSNFVKYSMVKKKKTLKENKPLNCKFFIDRLELATGRRLKMEA